MKNKINMQYRTIYLKSVSKELCFSVLALVLLCFPSSIFSQDCGCTVSQVEDNTVEACDLVIGNIVEVASTQEFKDAINMANNTGGSMTILIADGTYQVASTASFPYVTADNVVFRSLSGNRDAVILTGGGMAPTSSTEDGFLIAGDNVTIADLTIRSVGNHAIQVSGHGITVHNVRIQDTYEQMLKGSTSADNIDAGLVQCSLFEYTEGVGPNWYIGGIDVHKGMNWIVRDNVFKHIASPGNTLAEHAVHFWNNAMDITVERNIIYNCDRGIGFGLGDNEPQNNGGIIRNNMIYNDGSGMFDDVGIGLEASPNTRVYNNTIYVAYPNAIEYRFGSTSNVHIANNLTNKAITSRNGGTGILETNYTDAQDSWFTNLSSGNLRLLFEVEALVDQGTILDIVSYDLDQNIRPDGTAHDIGAQEWQTTSAINDLQEARFQIYPNPAKDRFVLRFDGFPNEAGMHQGANIYPVETRGIASVRDIYGKVVVNIKAEASRLYGEIEVDIQHLIEGIYFVYVGKQAVGKVVVVR